MKFKTYSISYLRDHYSKHNDTSFANPVLKIKNKRNLDLVMDFTSLAKSVPAAAVTQTRKLINISVKRTVIN